MCALVCYCFEPFEGKDVIPRKGLCQTQEVWALPHRDPPQDQRLMQLWAGLRLTDPDVASGLSPIHLSGPGPL